jgi:excisionase family DNA binding protein
MEEITVAEAAKLKGCSKTRILQLIRKSILPARRLGPVFVIPKYAVDAYQLPGRGRGSRRKRVKKNPNSNNISLD